MHQLEGSLNAGKNITESDKCSVYAEDWWQKVPDVKLELAKVDLGSIKGYFYSYSNFMVDVFTYCSKF